MITLDDTTIDKLATQLAARLNNRQKNTMTFEEARKQLFHGKSREWIKYYIFNRHPEVLTIHGGWITPPVKKGVRIRVLDVRAVKKWLDEHQHQIDWNSPEPITLRRAAGLAKPIRRNNK